MSAAIAMNWNWVVIAREKARATESCSLSTGQTLLPFSETGKTRRGLTCVRQEGNKSFLLARLRLRCLFRHASVLVK